MPTSSTSPPIQLSAINSVLTNFYIPRMWEMIQVEAPGFRFFKNLDFVNWGDGYTGTFPIRTKAKRGMVGGTTGKLPIGGAPSYEMATVNYTLFRCLINFTWDSKLISSNERYIKNLIDQAVTDCKNEYLRRFNTYLYTGFGSGSTAQSDNSKKHNGWNCVGVAVAKSDGNPSGTGTELCVGLPWTKGDGTTPLGFGGLWIEEGDYLRMVSTPETNSGGEFVLVTEVDRSEYPSRAKLKVSATTKDAMVITSGQESTLYLASPPGVGGDGAGGAADASKNDGGTFYGELSDYASKFMGLKDVVEGINPSTWDISSESTTVETGKYLGVTNSDFVSLVKGNSGTSRPLSQELLDQLILEQNERSFVRPNLLVMNTGMWHEYVGMSGHANEHFYTNRDSIPVGHSPSVQPQYFTVKATEAQGNVDILIDKYCPPTQIFAIDTSHVGYSEVHKMAEATEDGSFLRMSSTSYDEWFGFMRWGGQFAATSPQCVAVLKDLDQDIVAL